MNILGINGLGISPSACLIQDDKLVAMAEEERFNRFKGAFGFMPEKAVKFCLKYSGLKLKDINYIAFSWDADKYKFYMPYFFFITYLRYAPKFQSSSNILKTIEMILKYNPYSIKNQIKEMFHNIGEIGDLPKIIFVPHHISHALSSFYTSGFDKGYILVIDGSGEDCCTTIMKGEGINISVIKKIKIPNSIGWFYQSITEFLGFKPNNHEGKVMALSAYGKKNNEIFDKLKEIIFYKQNGDYKYNAKYSFLGNHSIGNIYSDEMLKLLGSNRHCDEEITDLHKTISYCSQKIIEDIVINIVKNIAKLPNYNGKICISGGVGLNCKMNGVVSEMDCVDELFVPPFPNDSGTSLGAAMYISQKKGFDTRFKIEHSYYGPYYSSNDVEKILIKSGAKFRKENEIEKIVAELIFNDKVIGWFQGRMEVGPRALGNRSILANPTKSWIAEYVNKKIKNREIWRPFAPSILYEHRYNYVLNKKQDAPFMAIAFKVLQKIKQQIPAVVHIDNTMRPQFVKKDVNPKFWNLINEFGKKSGVYVLLNTSFNDNEEPIVCSPKDALKTFYTSGLDYLVIEDFLVYK